EPSGDGLFLRVGLLPFDPDRFAFGLPLRPKLGVQNRREAAQVPGAEVSRRDPASLALAPVIVFAAVNPFPTHHLTYTSACLLGSGPRVEDHEVFTRIPQRFIATSLMDCPAG